MKYLFSLSVLVAIAAISGCVDKEENYPAEPFITFKSISFEEVAGNLPDTLEFTIKFTDGDRDFGLDAALLEHQMPPYHTSDFFNKTTGQWVSSDQANASNINQFLQEKDRATPPYDTLPAMNCEDYTSIFFANDIYTVYRRRNENHYNIFVDFLMQRPDGSFVEFDFFSAFCTNYDGRVFSGKGIGGPFMVSMANSKRGEITYKMAGHGFVPLFGDTPLKLQILIQDRQLNRSNLLDTPVFRLSEI